MAVDKMKTESAGVAWERSVDEFQSNLNEEDRQALKTLSKLLRSNRYTGTN